MIEEKEIYKLIDHPVFRQIGEAADELNLETYIVGGFVRDMILEIPSKDIDIVTVGSGIILAKHVVNKIGKDVSLKVYGRFGTAMVKTNTHEIEFVGARKESYSKDSRKPVVENGTLEDDQNRRDFTINAMAISLNKNSFGHFIDPFNGIIDLKNRIIRTPLDPGITFSDDPLRIIRAIRFATTLNFSIASKTFSGMESQAKRLKILSAERISDELNKIISAKKPSSGFILMDKCGILEHIIPELVKMKGVEKVGKIAHKDNFYHTMGVLDNIAKVSSNLWLRWAALLHDIGKPKTKKYIPSAGWTFYGHEIVGGKIAGQIFRRLKMPVNEKLSYVKKLINLHLRPIALVENFVTDSAIRRLLFEAGDDIDDLMTLCKADITSKNERKKDEYIKNFELVKHKLVEIEESDKIRNWQPPVSGEVIMDTFGIPASKIVGIIKTTIREAILEGDIGNNFHEAYELMITEGKKLGIESKSSKWKDNPPPQKKVNGKNEE